MYVQAVLQPMEEERDRSEDSDGGPAPLADILAS